MTSIRFTKMHGIGNDYVYIDAAKERVDDPAALARKIADRHFGVGGDGLILICPPTDRAKADVRMRMFNADGSESEMCGNGIRCVCKYAHDHGLSKANPMRIETGRGVLTLDYTANGAARVNEVTVDMGEPILTLPQIPVDVGRLSWMSSETRGGGIEVDGECWVATFVSMGNPHAVMFDGENPKWMHGDLRQLDLPRWGSLIERAPAFPNRINAHFVQVHSRREVTMRTWERGSGITLACGTGAAAVCVAGVLTNRTDREILAHLPGGDLKLRWDEKTNHVFKTGPATEVFSGVWNG
jgi:diaminopimelate epimerase